VTISSARRNVAEQHAGRPTLSILLWADSDLTSSSLLLLLARCKRSSSPSPTDDEAEEATLFC
jgi:hypothetical protein